MLMLCVPGQFLGSLRPCDRVREGVHWKAEEIGSLADSRSDAIIDPSAAMFAIDWCSGPASDDV